MDKIDFSDLYKFAASIGLILIGLSFVIPWFVNHDNSFLLTDIKTLKSITPVAKEIIISQQETLKTINRYIFWVSGLIFLIGISLLIWSLKKWWRRQSVIDEIQNEELKAKQISNMTINEKREIIVEEIASQTNGDVGEVQVTENQIDDYINIENMIFDKISNFYKSNYESRQNVKIGPVNYDMIMSSKKYPELLDKIIEVKIFSGYLDINHLKNLTAQLLIGTSLYKNAVKKSAMPYFIVIHEHDELPDILKQYKIACEKVAIVENKKIKVNFFKNDQVSSLAPNQFLIGKST